MKGTDTEAAADDLKQVVTRIRPEVRREKAYRVGEPPAIDVKLNQNESPYDLPEDLKEDLLEQFRKVAFNRYPDDQPERLMRAIGEKVSHPAAGIMVGNGSNELTHTLGLTLLAGGRSVVLPTPMFSLYAQVARLYGANIASVPPRADLSFDAEAIEEAVRRVQPNLTVLTTPNNPTGRAMPLAEIERIVTAAEGFVLVDEAYVEFTREESARTILDEHANLLLMRTFSKAAGLAGLRLGYLMGHPEVIGEMMKARLPFMVDRMAQGAALALLRRPEVLAERVRLIQASVEQLHEELAAIEAVEVVPSQANFVLFKTPVEPSEMMDRLARAGVLVRNMGGYPELQGYLRVNAGTPAENMAFLAALKDALHAG